MTRSIIILEHSLFAAKAKRKSTDSQRMDSNKVVKALHPSGCYVAHWVIIEMFGSLFVLESV